MPGTIGRQPGPVPLPCSCSPCRHCAAAAVGRCVFRGRLSSAAAQEDKVDWSLFDIVGIDYYSAHPNPPGHVRELRSYLRWGKPLAITEFGTCAYAGAPGAGGMGWNIITAA